MRDLLSDLIAHTQAIKDIEFLKISSNSGSTLVESLNTDRSLIFQAEVASQFGDVNGVIGLSNLDRLSNNLNNPEFKKDGSMTIVSQVRNGEEMPTHLEFSNLSGDFVMRYALMNKTYIEEKVKSAKFKNKVSYDISFDPSVTSINRLKLIKGAAGELEFFKVSTKKSQGNSHNLVFSFGDGSGHSGEFVFQANISKPLQKTHLWNAENLLKILSMSGKTTMNISDAGLIVFNVDTDYAKYTYMLSAKV